MKEERSLSVNNDNISSFIEEVTNEIEAGGITAGNIAEIAKAHGLSDPGLFISMPGFEKLFFLWDITKEAAYEIIDLLRRRDDFTANVSPLAPFISGGPIPTIPMTTKIYNYKKEHWIPVYFSKKEVKHHSGHQRSP
jgi:hypothetical protein